jgi:Ca-activated chloride channel family protein
MALVLAALCAASAGAQGPAQALSVKILAPDDDGIVSGPTTLRAEVGPPGVEVTVTFSVDGRQVCRVVKAPYECEFDAGAGIAQYQIRAVATGAGTRAATSIATRGFGFAETVDVELVQVTATVTDDGNHYVRGLPQTAFHLSEDGRPQTISHFASEDIPLELVLAIDVSGSMREAMPKVKEAVKEFLTALSARDQVTVLGFNDIVFPLARRATDPAQRLRAIDRLNPWGATALYDAIIAGVDTLGREAGRKAMIVFTDGEDQGSHVSFADVERRLQASDVTLYMIGQGRGVKMEPLKKILTRLSGVSGGRALITEKIDDLRSAFATMLQELSNQYLLGYTPTNASHDGTLRHLKLDVDGHHQVRSREVYRAPGPK